MKMKTLLFCGLFLLFVLKTNAQTVTDIDGNVYNTVDIGTQKWMAENLKTRKFNNGTAIPISISSWNNTTPNYCWYLNDSTTYSNPYGALYNWYVVGTGILCPLGWHVPTDDEWTTLGTFLGGNSVAGEKLKEVGNTHWNYYAYAIGTNTSGFSGVPGGQRDYGSGTSFLWKGDIGIFWTATEYPSSPTTHAMIKGLNYNSNIISVGSVRKKVGCSVRCINNNLSTGVEQNKTLDNFIVYPNPANESLTIQLPTNIQNGIISIKNLIGQNLMTSTITENKTLIDISKLKQGIYFVELAYEKNKMTLKFIKQ
jgi:uncharacterized protein (TIGR02145 family)